MPGLPSAGPCRLEGLAAVATSTTAAATLAGLSFNGLDGIALTSRGLLLDAQEGFAFVADTTQAKEFALARWLVEGADGGQLFVRCREAATDALRRIRRAIGTLRGRPARPGQQS
jgi:hypothetical protein